MEWHPALVHFPMGFAVASWISETIRTWTSPANAQAAVWESMSRVLLWWTLPALLLAVVSGNLANDAHGPQGSGSAVEVLQNHEALGYFTAAGLTFLAFWRSVRALTMSKSEQRGYWFTLTAFVLVMAWGATLGGRLVYQHGIGVETSPVSTSPSLPLH
jgi:uncharacterized membrane protein